MKVKLTRDGQHGKSGQTVELDDQQARQLIDAGQAEDASQGGSGSSQAGQAGQQAGKK